MAGARLYNSRGEAFMEGYDPERKDSTTRDIAAYAVFDQIRKGLDVAGGVVVDISALSDEKWDQTNPRLSALMKRRGINPRSFPLLVAPEAHYIMGGIAIDEVGHTNLTGLLAAGEVTGGVHGANRLDGNAIPETQVIACRAGRMAVSEALIKKKGRPNDFPLRRLMKRLEGLCQADEKAGRSDIHPLWVDLRQVADLSLGIIRNGKHMANAACKLRDLRDKVVTKRLLPTVQCLESSLELENLCLLAEGSLQAAMVRKESLGSHCREDYPERDPFWRRTIFLRWVNQTFVTETEPLPHLNENL
jgi:succinate dehydrogenase/fumarate reductase flavoprotein subunit